MFTTFAYFQLCWEAVEKSDRACSGSRALLRSIKSREKGAPLSRFFIYLTIVFAAACDSSLTRGLSDGHTDPDGGVVDSDLAPREDHRVSPDGPQPDQIKPPIPDTDSDGDGLPDAFEELFEGFDPNNKDSDGDGTPDGDEDDDRDGLTAAIEWAAYQAAATEKSTLSLLHKDLLVELDYQVNAAPKAGVLDGAIAAYAAANLSNPDGQRGINLHFYIDEKNLASMPMLSSLDGRLDYLGSHGPTTLTGPHTAKMVHVMFVGQRPDLPSRGGEMIASNDASAEKAGVLIYIGNLSEIFPTCLNPHPPAVTVDEATTSTLVHEIGHALQLGHDTDVGGGINPFNIMATDLGECEKLKQRTRGVGNTDAKRGAIESAGAPRFSDAAAALIKLRNKVSVETNSLEVEGGHQM